MIKNIILFWNGSVAVCDEHGQQVVELQGRYADVVGRLREQDLTEAEILVAESLIPGGQASPEEFLNFRVDANGVPLGRLVVQDSPAGQGKI